MTQILARCKVTVGAVAATGDTPASPEENYYFLSTYGVYAGTIATATGVTAEDADTDFSDQVIVPVKALLRQGVLGREVITLKDEAGKKYRKTLLVGVDQQADFDTLIVDDVWPVGKGAGARVFTVMNPLRVVSRR
ncbi:hypothetical protein [Nostoc sp. 'Peltigera membranacea cyanobiont' 232]|uniref:hypothetical protein n=1 Tax=Nostoc sp. 'Peltigera membranacea cyanobiont' 232 TaxID=2014531 RepID=UPI000B95331B|nr:hypothetical protein [Nostoc sp. 'Peltigera membranacea cyanobiont' 232]OYE04745.1 hypothetical protein CDG79_11445 [Nostoc sp. 'Peltigera membranacea cyanobiont' 232]